MADAKQAIDLVIRQEDSTLSGIITNRPSDRGGCTRFGLTERWHPELAAQNFFKYQTEAGVQVSTVATAAALAMAETSYDAQYSAPLMLAELTSQALATALLSFAVVEGETEAVSLLQKVIISVTPVPKQPKTWDNKLPPPVLAVDGVMGPQTVKLANAADQSKLLAAYVAFEEGYFQHLVSVIPAQVVNLKGWLNRAKAMLALPSAPATQAVAEEVPA